MTKTDLIRAIAKQQRITQAQATAIVADVFNTIANALTQGETVKIEHFGTFTNTSQKERKRLDIISREIAVTRAHHRAVFKPSEQLKQRINQRPFQAA